ncbi:ribokinase [Bacteroidia bacterium]|nr:ribokinase [Bacteroidia bacterium]
MLNRSGKFILTFGSCGWDRIFRKKPDGGRELVYEEEGRKNSHQAVAVRKAGAESMLVSFVGDDEIGGRVLESLKQCGVDTSHVTVVNGAATEVNNQILDPETKDYELERGPAELSQRYSPEMVAQYRQEILRADWVILVSKQPHDFLTEIIGFCFDNGIKTALTVSHRKFDVRDASDLETLRKCTVIAGNTEEMRDLTGCAETAEMLALLPNLMITSAAGVWFCDESGADCFEPSVPVPTDTIVETNGAGDTFIGNFMAARAAGRSILESVRIGQCASALEIQKMGVLNAMPNMDETLRLYNAQYKQNSIK